MDCIRVEHCDNRYRDDVIDDDRRSQKHAQLDRDPVAEQYDERNREGRVGTNRNAPSMP